MLTGLFFSNFRHKVDTLRVYLVFLAKFVKFLAISDKWLSRLESTYEEVMKIDIILNNVAVSLDSDVKRQIIQE